MAFYHIELHMWNSFDCPLYLCLHSCLTSVSQHRAEFKILRSQKGAIPINPTSLLQVLVSYLNYEVRSSAQKRL